MRRRLVLVAATAAGVLFVGVALPFCGTDTEWAGDKCIRGVPETARDSYLDGWSWSPLGTRCVLIEGDGTRREMIVPPWRDGDWASSD